MQETADNVKREGKRGADRLPPWFKIRLSTNERASHVRRLIRENNLHTVCKSAACPNQTECWNAGTATFMILGNVCTRGCRFCNVPKGTPSGLDADEPRRVAHAVAELDLSYAVVTSVTRDDLADGGAGIFAETIREIRKLSPECKVEVLIPDFQGSESALRSVLEASPDVLNHNIETVPSLYSRVRPQADYRRSLTILGSAARNGFMTKSGIMLGLGETVQEIMDVLHALRAAYCQILTLGQYLRPGLPNLPVNRFYTPAEFRTIANAALAMGFKHVEAGPLVRSSYHSEQYVSSLHQQKL